MFFASLAQDWALPCGMSWLGLGCFGTGRPCMFSVVLGQVWAFCAGRPGRGWVLCTGRPRKFFVNLAQDQGTSVLVVLVRTGCDGAGHHLQVLRELGSGLGTSVLVVLIGTG